MIHKIYDIFRSFVWTSNSDISRKSPISWKKICGPKKYDGLNIIELGTWNNTTMLKLLWNLCRKFDNLWVKWVHSYHIKGDVLMDMEEKASYS